MKYAFRSHQKAIFIKLKMDVRRKPAHGPNHNFQEM